MLQLSIKFFQAVYPYLYPRHQHNSFAWQVVKSYETSHLFYVLLFAYYKFKPCLAGICKRMQDISSNSTSHPAIAEFGRYVKKLNSIDQLINRPYCSVCLNLYSISIDGEFFQKRKQRSLMEHRFTASNHNMSAVILRNLFSKIRYFC